MYVFIYIYTYTHTYVHIYIYILYCRGLVVLHRCLLVLDVFARVALFPSSADDERLARSQAGRPRNQPPSIADRECQLVIVLVIIIIMMIIIMIIIYVNSTSNHNSNSTNIIMVITMIVVITLAFKRVDLKG